MATDEIDEKNEKRPATEAQKAAGRRNLLEFRANDARGPKPALSHGVRALLASGELPPVPGAEAIESQVEQVISSFVQDLGGEENVTAGQRVILSGLRLSLLVEGLAGLHLRSIGIADKKGRPNPILKVLCTYINSARLSSLALGLERRARKAGPATLAEYLEVAHEEPPTAEAPAKESENEPCET